MLRNHAHRRHLRGRIAGNSFLQRPVKVSTCVTDHLYIDYIVPPAGLEGEGQSIEGRLHDLLFRTLLAAKAIRDSDRAEFDVLFLMAPGRWDTAHVVAVIGPGDQGEPVMTIMLPEDD